MYTKKWKSYTEEKKKALLHMEYGWVLRNLLMYGNCLLPYEEIKKEFKECDIKKRLQAILGESIKIEKRINEDLGVLYIAEFE